MSNKVIAILAVTAIITLAFLYLVFPGHYVYSNLPNTWYIRERTDIFTGRVNLQWLDLRSGTWVNH